jgi:hypothetical protein
MLPSVQRVNAGPGARLPGSYMACGATPETCCATRRPARKQRACNHGAQPFRLPARWPPSSRHHGYGSRSKSGLVTTEGHGESNMLTSRAGSTVLLLGLLAAPMSIGLGIAPACAQGYPQPGYHPAPAPPPPCSAVNPGRGAVGSAGRGAAAGAAFGAIGGNAGRGAAVGAAVGGIAGAARRNAQRSAGYCY